MNRRDFLSLIGTALTGTPFFAHAQQTTKVYRIATVSVAVSVSEMSETGAEHYRAFLGELRRLGYVEGENLVVERFSAEGHPERFREIVGEVVRRSPDAVLAISGPGLLSEFKAQTATIPIVGHSADPVGLGIVQSLARPGGNITGVSTDGGPEIWGKSLGLLKEAIPKLSRVGLLVMRGEKSVAAVLKEAADKIGIAIVGPPLDEPIDETAYRGAFAEMVREGAEAIYVAPGTGAFFAHRQLIVELLEKQGVPAIYPFSAYVEIGGLMAYVADVPDVFSHAANQIDQILKGTKPGDIPFYQARKFDLFINLKTAKTLGLEMPSSLLAQADEVIE
jgi:putative tryptophan/tyrosine transport system substrate-binding protein